MCLLHRYEQAVQERNDMRARVDELEVIGHRGREALLVVLVDLLQGGQLRDQEATGLHALVVEACLQEQRAQAELGYV